MGRSWLRAGTGSGSTGSWGILLAPWGPAVWLALGGCRPAPLPPAAVWDVVDLDERVRAWASGPTTITSADGVTLGTVELERCHPLGAARIPEVLVEALLASQDDSPCLPGQEEPIDPLLRALAPDDPVFRDPWRDAARCSALKEALFSGVDACRPWLPGPDGQWIPLDDPRPLVRAWADLADFGWGDYGLNQGRTLWIGDEPGPLASRDAATLAALATRPEARTDPKALIRARSHVLDAMAERGILTADSAFEAARQAAPRRRWHRDPAPQEASVVAGTATELLERLAGDPRLRRGLTVRTWLDSNLQAVARKAVEGGLERWEWHRKDEAKRIQKVIASHNGDDVGLEEALKAAKIPEGAYIEAPAEKPVGAALLMDVADGRVRALVDDALDGEVLSKGALHRHRQAGSAWKTLLYATAISQGMTQADTFQDRRFTYPGRDADWSPKNHGDKYMGQVALRIALGHSLNSVAIQLIQKVGVGEVIRMARRLGISSRLRAVPALALGNSPVTLGELVSAYATFPAQGRQIRPRFVDQVVDAGGQPVAWTAPQPGPALLTPQVAYILLDMLRHTTSRGTASVAKALEFPVAGKTGTTNDSRDVWFVGFSSKLICGIWVGYDEEIPLGGDETGGTLAVPMWMKVMKEAAKLDPPADFPIPDGIVFETRSPWNGKPLKEGPLMAFQAPLRPPVMHAAPKNAHPTTPEDLEKKLEREGKKSWLREVPEEARRPRKRR